MNMSLIRIPLHNRDTYDAFPALELEGGPDVLAPRRAVPAEVGGERLDQSQAEPAETDRADRVDVRLTVRVVVGDVEDELTGLPEEPDDGGRRAVPQGIGRQLGGDDGEAVEPVLVVERGAGDGLAKIGSQVPQSADVVESPAAKLGRRRVRDRSGRRRHVPILPTPVGKTDTRKSWHELSKRPRSRHCTYVIVRFVCL